MTLVDGLKTLLGTMQAFRIKSQAFHWNIEGSDFPQYHALTDSIYSDADSSIDPLAEYIRSLDEYAPGSMTRFMELSIIEEQTKIPKAELMLKELLQDNDKIIELLKELFDVATEQKENGIANFLADRQTVHGKWHWQLGATIR